MIDIISGKIASQGENHLVVMVGGIGLHVFVTRAALQSVDETHFVSLITHLVVREDSLTLYGFTDNEERELFLALLGVSGVGPRLALVILSTLGRGQLHNAVRGEQPEILTQVPGIGKKTAQKIVFELKDKLGDYLLEGVVAINSVDADVIATLTALGYSVVEAQTALQSLPPDAPEDIEERVRLALQFFA
ncbi:MAG: Holliday junction branch migration protein RuvA [Chloroflexi bacterium]|nr:Holliday junction branch migration protein RuvA [Chloroflexota bacterium]